MNMMKSLKLRLKEKFNSSNLYLKYTIIFFLVLLIGLLPIEIKNESFLFSGLFVSRNAGIDGLKQHLIFMEDFVSHIKEGLFSGNISLFRYDIGLGSDLINHYTYYSLFDPLMIVAYIIPLKYVEVSFYVLVILRLYLTGIAAILLGKKLGIRKDNSLLVIGLVYTFSISVLFSAFRHPMFINGPMYFPLILLGYEKVKRGESATVLILSVFFALISQFYIFIYTTFGFILFELIDFIKEFKSKRIKTYIKINLYYILGVMLGGFVLLTQIYAILDGARVGSKGFELYQAIDYAVLIITNLLPIAGNHYTAGIGNFSVFIICCYFNFKEKKKSSYSLFFVVLFLLTFSAIFSYLINITSYVVNRWMYLLSLPASIIVGKYLDNYEALDDKSIKRSIKFIYIFVIASIYCLLAFGITMITNNKVIINISGISLFLIALVLCYLIVKSNVKGEGLKKLLGSKNLAKYIVYNTLFVVLITSGIYCFILSPNNALNTYYQNKNLYSEVLKHDGIYRVEQDTYVGGVKSFSNDGIYYNYPSTASYNSITNGKILEFIEEYDIANSNNSVGYNGFNGRSRILAINHVKYVIVRESDKVTPPYGFSYYTYVYVSKYDDDLKMYHKDGNILKDENGNEVLEKAYIYINNLLLNFGVIYDSYLTYEDVSSLNSVEKELLLTKTIIVDGEKEDVAKFSEELSVNRTEVLVFSLENIEVEDKIFNVEDNGKLRFTIPNVNREEVYINIEGIKNLDYYKSYTTTYYTNLYSKSVQTYGYASNMYIENKDHLVNLGYYEDANDLEVVIEFTKGIYNIESIGYYLVDVSSLNQETNKLNANALSDVQITNSTITGKINTETSGYMFLSIPYSSGFRAFIDGIEVDILKANTGYMAIFVQKGNKELEIKYFTPGLEIGLYVSAVALIAFILILRFELVNKISRNNQTNKKEENNEKNSTVSK